MVEDILGCYGFKSWPGILPGVPWLEEHEHDHAGWEPIVELSRPGFKTTFTLKDPKTMREVAKSVMR